MITGGRGSGKSFAVNNFIENLTFQKGHTILFTRYTLVSAGKSIIPEFVEKIDLQEHNEHFKITNNEVINTKTNSKVIFSGIKTSSGNICLLYTSPSPRDRQKSRMPSSA